MAAPFHPFSGFETLAPEIGRTNVVLDDDQALCVRKHLVDAQNELHQWDRNFAVLLAKRARIVDRVYRCKVALAPYKKLPVEIMREIVVFAVGVPPELPLDKKATLDPRLQITQVCTDWRRIAFAIPGLWKITLSCIPNRSSTSKLIDAWWSQCSGHHLSLISNERLLQKPGQNRYFAGISFDHFLFEHLIIPYSTRLVELKITMRVETARKMLALPARSFKALKTLVLITAAHSEPLLCLEDISTAFSFSPSLSSVAIHARSVIDPLLLHLPWHQLTMLTMTSLDIPADIILSLFSYCPLLSTCRINVVKDIDADMVTRIASIPVPHLANLTVLHLTFAGTLNHHHFLRALSLPKLGTLGLSLVRSHVGAMSDYAAFLQSITPTLRHFRFQVMRPHLEMGMGMGIPPDHHFDELLLSYMPGVLTFEIPERFMISPSVWERIARGELLPSVKAMTFGVSNLRPVLEMLDARLSRSRKSTANGQTAISAINTAVVSCSSSSGMEDMIQGLKDQGIDIKVVTLS